MAMVTRAINDLTRSLEGAHFRLAFFLLGFTALIFFRMGIENSLSLFPDRTLAFLYFEFTHTFFTFFLTLFLFLPVVRYFGRTTETGAAGLLLYSFLIILMPPLVDAYVFRNETYWSYYEFNSLSGLWKDFYTFFANTPQFGITTGPRLEIAIGTLALALFFYARSKSIIHTLTGSLIAYAVFFFISTLPTWMTLLIRGPEKGFMAISDIDVAGFFLSPMIFFGASTAADLISTLSVKMSLVYAVLFALLAPLYAAFRFPKIFKALARNARLPQLVYHAGLLSLGMLLGWLLGDGRIVLEFFHILAFLALLVAVEAAWLASVVANDVHDQRIDSITNPSRPLVVGAITPDLYRDLGILFFAVSIIFAGLVSFKAMCLLLVYQAIAWIYSSPPLRLKRVPVLATILAALAGLLVLVTGYVVVAPEGGLSTFPPILGAFLFAAYASCLPLKDLKDIAGDRADGVYTIPVLLGEERGKLVIASVILFCILISPTVFHESLLFWPAVIFGALAFRLVMISKQDAKYFSYHKLPGWMMSLITFYGLIASVIVLVS